VDFSTSMIVGERVAQKVIWVLVSNMFYFHPYLRKIPILTNIFQRGWNHQLVIHWFIAQGIAHVTLDSLTHLSYPATCDAQGIFDGLCEWLVGRYLGSYEGDDYIRWGSCVFGVNIYHIGDTKSAQELEVFLRMPSGWWDSFTDFFGEQIMIWCKDPGSEQKQPGIQIWQTRCLRVWHKAPRNGGNPHEPKQDIV